MENTFLVTPMSQNINLKPGETYVGSITVSNSSSSVEDFSYKVSVSPYSVIGKEYNADLATVSNWSLIKDWIKIDENTGTLKPNESKKVNFTINVPKSAPAGGQYAAILVTENNSSNGALVDSVFEIASLVYANVAGETTHKGEILKNDVPGFVTDKPITLSASFSNEGNVHEIAVINIRIKNVLTGEEILPSSQNDGNYNEVIMPETERVVTYSVEDLPVVGVVEISQTINYNGITSAEAKNVVICPIWFMVLMLLVIFGSIFGVIKLIKRRRHKKMSI